MKTSLADFIRGYNIEIDEVYIDTFCKSFYQKKWIQLTSELAHLLDIQSQDIVTSTLILNEEFEEVVVDFDKLGNTRTEYFVQPQAFKKLLLSINTFNSEKALNSYKKFEECIPDYLQYQQEQIKIKDQQLIKKEVDLVNCLKRLEIKDSRAFIYVATTDIYASHNHYKIGSTSNLTKRLSSYNVGRPKNDKYRYVWTKKCDNNVSLEKYILSFVGRWKDTKNAEMVIIHLPDLLKLIEYICDNHERIIDFANGLDNKMDTSF
jgi:T5orf172 domain